MTIAEENRRAIPWLVFTFIAWGSIYPISKAMLETVPPLTLMVLRYAAACLVLLPMAAWRGRAGGVHGRAAGGAAIKPRPTARDGFLGVAAVALVGYTLGIGAQVYGTKFAQAQAAIMINSMNPIGILLFAAILLRERVTAGKLLAIASSVAGALIIIAGTRGAESTLGVVLSFVSMSLWSLSSVMARSVTTRFDTVSVTAGAIAMATLASAPFAAMELAALPPGGIAALVTPFNVAGTLFMGLFSTALGHLAWNRSLATAEASFCSMFYPLQPMVSALIGAIFLGHEFGPRFFSGGALIVAGILIGTSKRASAAVSVGRA